MPLKRNSALLYAQAKKPIHSQKETQTQNKAIKKNSCQTSSLEYSNLENMT